MQAQQRFWTKGDDGSGYEVYVWRQRIVTSSLGQRSSLEGLPELRTSTGLRVNRLSKGRYQIVQTGVILESNDPQAF